MRKSAVILKLIAMSLLTVSPRLFAIEPKTVITGNQMEITQAGQMIVFSGNSRVTRGRSVLTAEKIIQDKKNNVIEAIGDVGFETFTADNELLFGRAQKVKYTPSEGKSELFEGRPKVIYNMKSSTSPMTVEADRIYFDENRQEIRAEGQVQVISSSVCAYAPFILFKQKEKKIFMSGADPQPEIVYLEERHKGRYSADNITMFLSVKKVYLKGNVHGKMDLSIAGTR